MDESGTSNDSTQPRDRGPNKLRRVIIVGCWIGAVVFVVAFAMAGLGAYSSWQAELNLHSTLYVTRLVDQYVQQNGRWPKSWADLEAMPYDQQTPKSVRRGNVGIAIGGGMQFQWPQQSPELRDRVTIDFDATPQEVINADVVKFQPIRPNGPYYDYWKYGFIEHLQESMRQAATSPDRESPAIMRYHE